MAGTHQGALATIRFVLSQTPWAFPMEIDDHVDRRRLAPASKRGYRSMGPCGQRVSYVNLPQHGWSAGFARADHAIEQARSSSITSMQWRKLDLEAKLVNFEGPVLGRSKSSEKRNSIANDLLLLSLLWLCLLSCSIL